MLNQAVLVCNDHNCLKQFYKARKKKQKQNCVYESEVARQSWLSSDFWTYIFFKNTILHDDGRPLTNPKFRTTLDLNLYFFFQNSSLYTQSHFKSSTLISVFHTWNDKLYRHRRGKVYFNKSQSTQSLPAYQRFKGELDDRACYEIDLQNKLGALRCDSLHLQNNPFSHWMLLLRNCACSRT